MHLVGRYYVTLLLNRELVNRVKLCLVSVFPDIVKDCPKMRNLPKIYLRSFENVGPARVHLLIYYIVQLQLYLLFCHVTVIDFTRTEGSRLHWLMHLVECQRSEYVGNRARYRQHDTVAYVLAVSKLDASNLLWSCESGKNQRRVVAVVDYTCLQFLFFTLCLHRHIILCPVWAREHCRISPSHFLAECCKRRLNQASFILLCFALFVFFLSCV